jgi:periplasmic divalent cation tolerance protein
LPREYIQVSTTTGSKQDADRIAKHLVEEKLAACAQVIGPISSSYWWRGKIESAEEWLCIIKTKRTLFGKIQEAIRAVHSYEVPEITAVSYAAMSKNYLEWLENAIA